MSVPSYPSLVLPLLQILGDSKERFHKDLVAAIAEKMNLTDAQQSVRNKQGETILSYNLRWAETYLFNANLVMKPQKACYQITESGLTFLRTKPDNINIQWLRKQWLQKIERTEHDENEDPAELIAKPPEALLEEAHAILCSELAQELLDQVKSSHWRFFERIVVDLLINMGYGGSRSDAGKVVGKSGDNGIDGIINEDKLGLDIVYIQAKKYSDSVTISQVRDFAGALLARKARKGVFITTSSFPKSAEEFVAQIEPKIILIDGQRLAEFDDRVQCRRCRQKTAIRSQANRFRLL